MRMKQNKTKTRDQKPETEVFPTGVVPVPNTKALALIKVLLTSGLWAPT